MDFLNNVNWVNLFIELLKNIEWYINKWIRKQMETQDYAKLSSKSMVIKNKVNAKN